MGAARGGRHGRGRQAPLENAVTADKQEKQQDTRVFIATVVVVGPPERLAEAGSALESLGEVGGAVRVILISEGHRSSPATDTNGHTVTIEGLAPRFLNNAVA